MEVGIKISGRFEVNGLQKNYFYGFIYNIYTCTDFIRTSISVFDRLSGNLDIMCKYG